MSFQEDLLEGQSTLRKFIRELGPRESVLNDASFGALHLALNRVVDLTDHCITRGVVERFWDTNNTFYFPSGEMIITPYDFPMLMGMRFAGAPLVY